VRALRREVPPRQRSDPLSSLKVLTSSPAMATPDSRTGTAFSIEREYQDHGFGFALGNDDRRAGYLRIAEMLCLTMNRANARENTLFR
jgi:hypothetical protein